MKKGFTLIELLAVIVILAVIALIAIPQITNLVSNIRLKADLESVRGYINAADAYYMKAQYNTELYDTLGTNVIDKLDIKGTKLEGSVVITRDGKVEVAIIKNNKCYKKSAMDDNNKIDVLDKSMCSSNTSTYVSNNGQLHVCGYKLCNESNKEVRIIGASGNNISTPVDETSKEAFNTLKSWGANAYRTFVWPKKSWGLNYVGNEETLINRLKRIIDNVIANDIIVNWDPFETDGISYTDNAIDFFKRVANLYPNDPHIIYEIWNEPSTSKGVTWNDVKTYANKVIPEIRNISPNSIIIVGTVGGIDSIFNDRLSFENVMYTFHSYPVNVNGTNINRLKSAMANNFPFFITEWGSVDTNGNWPEYVVKEPTYAFYNFLEQHQLSHMFFGFFTSSDNGSNKYGIVKTGNWDSSLSDSILKPNGLLLKKMMRHEDLGKSNILMENTENTFRSSEWKDKITSIEFKTNKTIPSNSIKTWDLSLVEDNGVVGYLLPTSENDRYKLVIASDKEIFASRNSTSLFASMSNLKSINFKNFNTKYLQNMQTMFSGDTSLETLDLSSFDTSLISNIYGAFNNCSSLKSINFKNWSPSITTASMAFNKCSSLESLDLSGFDMSKVTNVNVMFYQMTKLKSINLSTWSLKDYQKVNTMFSGDTNLESLDISNFNLENSNVVVKDLFKDIKSNASIKVKTESMKNSIKTIYPNMNVTVK